MYSCPVYILKKYTVSVPIILIHHIWFWPIVLYYVAMAQCSNNVMISFQKIFWQKTIMIFPMVFSILCIVFLWRLLGGLYTNRSLLLKKILEFISTFFYLQVRKSKKMIDIGKWSISIPISIQIQQGLEIRGLLVRGPCRYTILNWFQNHLKKTVGSKV